MTARGEPEGLRSFVDTNVIVYSVDGADERRQHRARQLLRSLRETDALRTSTQVLGEFFVTATRKIRVPISPAEALAHMNDLAEWPVIATDYRMVRDACELSLSARISYWDALILLAAMRAGARRIYSEDLNAGQKILGIEIINPF
jgi:predicted nucleic acid-binding protein